eukprot:m.112936 g.112936  ORF g.112936 m.112936 type:complete len:526 (+) comp14113_c0_seq1:119-1696(+)
MAGQNARIIPRAWVSGTKRSKLIALLIVLGFVGLGFVMFDRAIPHAGSKVAVARAVRDEIAKEIDGYEKEEEEKAVEEPMKEVEIQTKKEEVEEVAEKIVNKGNVAVHEDQEPDDIIYDPNPHMSCQSYAEKDPKIRNLEESKEVCTTLSTCNSIECPHGETSGCTLRKLANPFEYQHTDCYVKTSKEDLAAKPHPMVPKIIKEYPFQGVTTQKGVAVNIILVRTPFGASGNAARERALYEKYRDDILFMGISSFEDYPMDSMNPFSPRIDSAYYLKEFPGFLHMMHEPEKHFAPSVKTLLMSQSDFQLPDPRPSELSVPKKYDFIYAATWPLGVGGPTDHKCIGWSGYCKNWSFVYQALEVMCGEFNLTGVLIATADPNGVDRCDIPEVCHGRMTQTTYIRQDKLFNYMKQSHFSFIPQMHDASPRVATQALVHNIPILMNYYISGGWKYINDKTGQFFRDMSDFRESLKIILDRSRSQSWYEPRKWVLDNYGNENSGKRLLDFVKENFAHRVKLPKHTTLLLT